QAFEVSAIFVQAAWFSASLLGDLLLYFMKSFGHFAVSRMPVAFGRIRCSSFTHNAQRLKYVSVDKGPGRSLSAELLPRPHSTRARREHRKLQLKCFLPHLFAMASIKVMDARVRDILPLNCAVNW